MIDELSCKMMRLEDSINMLRATRDQNPALVSDINSQFAVADSLIEFFRIPGDALARYNAMKLEYAQLFDNRRMYYSTERSIRINKITQDTEHIIDTQEFIRQYIDSQAGACDALAANMVQSENTIENALSELETHKTHVHSKMQCWRYLAAGVGLVGTVVLCRVLFG